MNPLRAATLSVADPDASAAAYARWFDYRVVGSGTVGSELAASWQAPAVAGRRSVVVRPASGATVDLRFVQAAPVAGYLPLRTYGWAAIELVVQDVLALREQLRGGPFEVIGEPVTSTTLPTIQPMQVQGPDGEVIYLTEIKRGGPGSGLPAARSPVDALFIAVLACADMRASAAWLAGQLALTVDAELTLPYRMLNRAFGLPAGTEHRIVTASAPGAFCFEFDRLPEGATARPVPAGALPPGVALCSVLVADLDAIAGPWLSPPHPHDDAFYGGRRAGVLRLPEGALLEVIEAEPGPPRATAGGRAEP